MAVPAGNSWFSPDGVMAILGVTTVVGGGIGTYLRRIDAQQEKELKTVKDDQAEIWKALRASEKVINEHSLYDARTFMTREDHAFSETKILTALKDLEARITNNIKIALDALAKKRDSD